MQAAAAGGYRCSGAIRYSCRRSRSVSCLGHTAPNTTPLAHPAGIRPSTRPPHMWTSSLDSAIGPRRPSGKRVDLRFEFGAERACDASTPHLASRLCPCRSLTLEIWTDCCQHRRESSAGRHHKHVTYDDCRVFASLISTPKGGKGYPSAS